MSKDGYAGMPMGISCWSIPDTVAAKDEVKLVRSFELYPRVKDGLRLFLSGFATIQSKGGSDVGGQVYVKVDGHAVSSLYKYTVDRWAGAGDGFIRLPIPFGGNITFPDRSGNSPLTVEVFIESAGSEFSIVNGQGNLNIWEAPND